MILGETVCFAFNCREMLFETSPRGDKSLESAPFNVYFKKLAIKTSVLCRKL